MIVALKTIYLVTIAVLALFNLGPVMTMPTHTNIMRRLADIATRSCLQDDGQGNLVTPSGDQNSQATQTPNSPQLDRLILQSLRAANVELTTSLEYFNTKGVIHNAMNVPQYAGLIESIRNVLVFRSEWRGSETDLTSQQVVRIKALVRMTGYVYLMKRYGPSNQSQDPTDQATFGADTQELQTVLRKLQQVTCSLQYLLPTMDLRAQVMDSEIGNSFSMHISRQELIRLLMGLLLQDIRQFADGMRVSVADNALTVG